MARRKKLPIGKTMIAVAIPLLIVGGVFTFLFATQPLPEFIDYATFETDEFNLRFLNPFAVTGTESFLIKCELRNQILIKDEFGQTRLTIDKRAPFSPAIELSFIIPVSGMPNFGSAVVTTFLSCSDSPLASSGFKAFLHDGFITTKVQATDVNRSFKSISTRTNPINQITDMNNRNNFQLNTLTITENQLQNTIGDETSYPSTVRALVTGELHFRQCLLSNANCTSTDGNANWIKTVSTGDAFTAFGLLVEGSVFSPVTRTQELKITESDVTSDFRLNIKDDNRVSYQVRITDYDIREGSPVTKIWTPQNTVFQTRNEGILTATDPSNSRIFIKNTSVTLPTSNLGLWCFELQKTEGLRQASRKCITTFLADATDPVIDPMIMDPKTGADISSGEVRLRYEVTTTSGVKQNDITTAGGTAIAFTPLQLLAIGGTDKFLTLFLQPQIFFAEGVIADLNVVSGSADIVYTGSIKLPDSTVTITSLELKPNPADFTKNQASIILPSTKITADQVELLIKQQSGLPSSGVPITLEILTSGTFQLKDTGTNALHLGTFKDVKFSWNLDYTPANVVDSCLSSNPPASCTTVETCNGVVIVGVCVTNDLSTCFDASGAEVQCESIDDPVEQLPTTNPDPDTGNKCFNASGVEISCTIATDCDPNIDPDRCGGGAFDGNPDEIPDDSNNGSGGICESIIGSFLDCADAQEMIKPTTEPLDITKVLSENLQLLGIVTALIIIIGIVIAIIIRFARNR